MVMGANEEDKNLIIWIMGPTSSGKTTIAERLLLAMKRAGRRAIHYDGDEVRDFFGPSHGFESKDRLRVVKTITHLANKAYDSGGDVIVSALTANQDAREYIAEHLKGLILVYLHCSIDECAKRDPKGLYRKALNGEMDTLIGVSSEYCPIDNADIEINTEVNSIGWCVNEMMARIESERYRKPAGETSIWF